LEYTIDIYINKKICQVFEHFPFEHNTTRQRVWCVCRISNIGLWVFRVSKNKITYYIIFILDKFKTKTVLDKYEIPLFKNSRLLIEKSINRSNDILCNTVKLLYNQTKCIQFYLTKFSIIRIICMIHDTS